MPWNGTCSARRNRARPPRVLGGMRTRFVAGLLSAVLVGCGGSGGSAGPSRVSSEPIGSAAVAAPESPASEAPDGSLSDPGLQYVCGQVPFDPDVLAESGAAETGSDPAEVALREHLASGGEEAIALPSTGWLAVGGSQRLVEFVAPRGIDGFAFVLAEQDGETWGVTGWGGCRPTAVLAGASLATWNYAPDEPEPGPGTTTFAAVVTERACTGGRPMGERLLPPDISYGETVITIIFAARPLTGGHDCPGNPSSRVTVQLLEPLGDRVLRDGAFFPANDPAVIPD